jgi:Ca-activated chloride channel homolog
MTFDRPWLLLLIAAPLVLAAGYLVAERLRRRHAVRFASTDLLATVVARRSSWFRHLPVVGVLLALVALVLAAGRPTRTVDVAVDRATVMLAVDTSASMAADDVEPDRLTVATEAAASFAQELPDTVELGLITYDGTVTVAVAPTTDRRAVVQALETTTTGPGTATGDAVVTALEVITDHTPSTDPSAPDAAPAAAIVVMSDGTTTVGIDDADAVAAATDAGVAVTTIAYGTAEGSVEIDGETIPVPVDPEALAAIADGTGGAAYTAEDAGQLTSVYESIRTAVGTEERSEDLAPWFSGMALGLLALAAAGSLIWNSRLT